MIREERHQRRDHAEPLDERVPERAERDLVAVPEATARAPDVPVREIVDERLVRADDVDGQPALVRRGRVRDERVRPLDEPAVERLELAARSVLEIREVRRPALDVRVVDEELARVPECEQLPLDLVSGAESEEEIAVRRLRAVLPAHDVRTHARERVRRVDRVSPRAVHLTAGLVEHLLVAEHAPIRRASRQGDRHEVLRVEPQPDLLAHLRHPVGREPLLPVRVVGEVGGRQPLRRTRRVPLGYPFRVLPAERRERHDAGVEPDVADLRDAPHGLGARLAANRYLVDPRPAELLELLEPGDGTLHELGLRADDGHMPARARVDRQRQPVVATPRDVPVAHVAQPVVHALAHVRRRPLDGRVRVEQRLPQLVDRDEPVVRHPPDQRRVAAPAVRIAVLVLPDLEQEAGLGEPTDDLVCRLRRREPVQPAVGVVEAPGLVDRGEHGQVVDPAEVEVLLARPGGDVHDPASLVERDLVPRDDAMLDLRARAELVERSPVSEPDELRTLDASERTYSSG